MTSAIPTSDPIPLLKQKEDASHSNKVVTAAKVPSRTMPIHPQVLAHPLSVFIPHIPHSIGLSVNVDY